MVPYSNIVKVDGVDSRLYGVAMLSGTYAALMSYPKLKSVKTVNWQERDGLEADLSSPVLDARTVKIPVLISEGQKGLDRFIRLVTCSAEDEESTAYHTFYAEDLKRSWTLRLESFDIENDMGGSIVVTFSFSDDFPLKDYEYLEPEVCLNKDKGYAFDGNLFSDYGVTFLDGTAVEAMALRSVKKALICDNVSVQGISYDGKMPATYGGRDLSLPVAFAAGSVGQLNRNMNALVYDFIRPEARSLKLSGVDGILKAYWGGLDVDSIYLDGRVRCFGKLKLTVIGQTKEEEIQ